MDRTPVALASRPPGSALLRQATQTDRAAIREFVCALSPRSQYLRFFACVAPPSSGLLAALCGAAGRADVLLITDDGGTVIGHGMTADEPGQAGHACSVGLVIADAWQRLGLGTLLLRTLTSRAARRGARSLVLEVLPENRVMLGIIARRWPQAPSQRTPDAIVFRPVITAPEAGQGWPVPSPLRVGSLSYHGGLGAPDRSAA